MALRPLREPDFAPFARAFVDDPGLHLRVGRAAPHTERSIAEETAVEDRARERGSWARFAIARARDDALGGALLLHDVNWRHRRAEVGLWVAPDGRGAGAGTRALALACRLVFGHLGFDRLQLYTEASNRAMRALAARAGFREEGVLRAYQRDPDGGRPDIVHRRPPGLRRAGLSAGPTAASRAPPPGPRPPTAPRRRRCARPAGRRSPPTCQVPSSEWTVARTAIGRSSVCPVIAWTWTMCSPGCRRRAVR